MSTRLMRWLGVLALVVVMGPGCGEDSDPPEPVGELLPLNIGNRWTYYDPACPNVVVADTVLSGVDMDGVTWYPTARRGFIFPVALSGHMLRWDEQGRLHSLINGVDGIALDPDWPVQEGHFVPVGPTPADSQRVTVVIHTKRHTEVVLGQNRSDCYVVGINDRPVIGGNFYVVLCPGIGMVRRGGGEQFRCPLVYTLTSYHLETTVTGAPAGLYQP